AVLEPTDVITITTANATRSIGITNTQLGGNGEIRVQGVAENMAVYDMYAVPDDSSNLTASITPPGETEVILLDLPALPGDETASGTMRVAMRGVESGWGG